MIALLFALLTVAMLLILLDDQRFSYTIFGVVIVLGAYWLHFHATTPLSVVF